MLVVGEMDENVPAGEHVRFVDALVRRKQGFRFSFRPNGGSRRWRHLRPKGAFRISLCDICRELNLRTAMRARS